MLSYAQAHHIKPRASACVSRVFVFMTFRSPSDAEWALLRSYREGGSRPDHEDPEDSAAEGEARTTGGIMRRQVFENEDEDDNAEQARALRILSQEFQRHRLHPDLHMPTRRWNRDTLGGRGQQGRRSRRRQNWRSDTLTTTTGDDHTGFSQITRRWPSEVWDVQGLMVAPQQRRQGMIETPFDDVMLSMNEDRLVTTYRGQYDPSRVQPAANSSSSLLSSTSFDEILLRHRTRSPLAVEETPGRPTGAPPASSSLQSSTSPGNLNPYPANQLRASPGPGGSAVHW